ncbi:MAG: hypothetical protein ACJAYE_000636 [Candidatus Azotimanducaceae bacterium]|jgi:hypothetical protein
MYIPALIGLLLIFSAVAEFHFDRKRNLTHLN